MFMVRSWVSDDGDEVCDTGVFNHSGSCEHKTSTLWSEVRISCVDVNFACEDKPQVVIYAHRVF